MIKGLILSLQFLTRLPINIEVDFNRENLGRALFFFPLVGGLIGAWVYLFYWGFYKLTGSLEIGAIMGLVAYIFITGGLHLDGLADSCDGFFSNKDRETMLEIMSDSRIGAFGVLALVLIILLKYIVYKNLGPNFLLVVSLSIANSRLVEAYIATSKEPAKDTGMGVLYTRAQAGKYFKASFVVYLLVLFILDPVYIIPLLISLILGELIYIRSFKEIEGFTGDTLGATAELVEPVSILTFLGVINWIL